MEMLLYIAAYLFYLYVPLKKSMHMYQQNRYDTERYGHWLLEEVVWIKGSLIRLFLILCLSDGLLLVPKKEAISLLLVLVVLIIGYIAWKIEEGKTYRKPLVYTARIHRLQGAMLLCIIVGIWAMRQWCSLAVQILLTPCIFFLPWLLVALVGIMLRPVEQAIRHAYMRKAKALLLQHDHLHIIGITGSYGKTSVKNILYQLMRDDYETLMTPQSYNNQMGITLTIRQQLTPLHTLFLCEMGADHVREIHDLMQFVKPHFGIVTTVGPQHLSTFGSQENILYEKMQMIECLPADGIGFLNADNALIQSYSIQNTCSLVWFGFHEQADFRACDITMDAQGSWFRIVHGEESQRFHTKLLGRHNVLNITCAIAVARTFGISWEKLSHDVEALPYTAHRLEVKQGGICTILDDAYNANPQGAAYALEVLRAMPHRHFIITPGYLELGEKQMEEQVRLGEQIAQSVEAAILVGEQQTKGIVEGALRAGLAQEKLYVVNGIEEAFAVLKQLAQPLDYVLLENDLPDAFNH